jgi:hypothetical protein
MIKLGYKIDKYIYLIFTTKCFEFTVLPNAVTCKIPLGDYEKFACMALSNLK